MKYFFLSNGWIFQRVWENSGLWDENLWRRKPEIKRLNLGIQEQNEILWLYQVEDAVLMLEVKATTDALNPTGTIAQVILKRLLSADQAIEVLAKSEKILNSQ